MIVVTAATGQFGRLVVENLLERGVGAGDVAVAVRDPDKAAAFAERGVEVRHADYAKPETLAPAFKGADKLLLVSGTGPDEARTAQHRAAVAAAKEAAVGLLAYTSIFDAPNSPLGLARVHRDTEAAIAESALPSVLLRNGWYTENYTAALAASVRAGAIAGSAGQGRIASAGRADMAEAAAIVLAGEGHAGKVYELTGDTSWSLPQLAAEAAAQSGVEVLYTDLPPEQYAQMLAGFGLPAFLVDLLVDADVQISRGALETATGDLAALLGRPTTPLSAAVAAALRG